MELIGKLKALALTSAFANIYIQIFLVLIFIFFFLDILDYIIKKYGKYSLKIQYMYYYLKVKRLELKIYNDYYFIDFIKTKRVVLWIMILRRKNYNMNMCLDIAFLKVYDITGIDGLTTNEKGSF